MKRLNYKFPSILIIILTYLALSSVSFSQTPELFSYQAVVRNASGALVKNSNVGMRISILKDSTGGKVIYTETWTAATNTNGLVSVEVGGGTTTDTFSGINWFKGPYFIKTEIDPAGGTSYTITGISQLLSVPYSHFAKNGVVAYGNISSSGTIKAGSNNYTVTKTGTGTYEITWAGSIKTYFSSGIVNITTTFGNPRMTSWTSTNGGATLIVYIYDKSGNTVDDYFSFTVFQPNTLP